MAYIPNPTDATQPVGSVDSSTADDEFRALKAYLQSLVISAGVTAFTERQCVLDGVKDANNRANFLQNAGAGGLALDFKGAPDPWICNFSGGFSNIGQNDRFTTLTNDVANVVTGLAPLNTPYIYADYVDASSVTWGSTLVPPQYGQTYRRDTQGLMHFEGADASVAMIDDYGNTWTPFGNAQIDTAQFKFGASSLLLDGTGDYIETTDVVSLGGGSWNLDMWVRWNVLPTAANRQTIFTTRTASDDAGILLYLFNNAGTMRMELYASSLGAGVYDIANATVGTKTAWAINTWYHICLTYDAVSGKYLVYVDGTQDISVASAVRVAGFTGGLRLGRGVNANPREFNGWFDEFNFNGYCKYPNGVTFIPPVAPYTVEGDFFNIGNMKMYGVTAASAVAGTNPTLTSKYRVYQGEVTTSAAAVTAIRNYAFRGKYVSSRANPFPAISTQTTFQHNIGVPPRGLVIEAECLVTQSGYKPGERLTNATSVNAGPYGVPYSVRATPLEASFAIQASLALTASPAGGGTAVTLTPANWAYRVYADRGW